MNFHIKNLLWSNFGAEVCLWGHGKIGFSLELPFVPKLGGILPFLGVSFLRLSGYWPKSVFEVF